MKKVLATVAALGLVLGVTANALALDQPSRAADVLRALVFSTWCLIGPPGGRGDGWEDKTPV